MPISLERMTDNEEHEPEGPAQSDPPKVVDPMARSALKGPGGRSEKALGLQMARLFGLPPQLLMSPPVQADRSTPPDEEAAEGDIETAGGEQGGD